MEQISNCLTFLFLEYHKCRIRVTNMNLCDKTEHLLEEHRTSFLQTLINFNYQMMISALGALLYFLDTYVSKIMLKIPSQHILSVKILHL